MVETLLLKGRLSKYKKINREISWLSFNERVLQEAEDPSVPLIERVRFLGIFSNNRDEFFRVRVATLERLSSLNSKGKSKLDFDPDATLSQIQEIVLNQERKFSKIYKELIKKLEHHKIFILDEEKYNKEQSEFVTNYFDEKIRGTLVPLIVNRKNDLQSIKDNAIYLAVKLWEEGCQHKATYSVIEIPSKVVSRFLLLPSNNKDKFVTLIDDVIRFNLRQIFHIFKFDHIEAYTFKITRDAELDIEDDLSQSWIDKLSQSLKNRKSGDPVRFVYDRRMPEDILKTLIKKLGISDVDNVVPVSYPYQKFSYIIDLMREAAIDPTVQKIQINLYRVANQSKIINALINAVRNGKKVVVILELTARFDEENNIKWSGKLSDAGVQIIHGVPGLKVHSKLILIERIQKGKLQQISHIGTGNFHEGTAKIYGDYSLLTSDKRITSEVQKVFEFFEANYKRTLFRHLVVSPFNARRRFNLLINNEIRNAKKGLKAKITIKVNNLVDDTLIKKLYEASEAGVKIKLLIRGICALVPGIEGMSENIEAYSIVDRFLEHARVMVFYNSGDPLYLLGSTDWMKRNLDHRIEVVVPVYDTEIQKEIQHMLDLQLKDDVKRRILDSKMSNVYCSKQEKSKHRSQIEQYNYFKSLVK